MPALISPFLLPIVALIAVTPQPIAIQLGPIPVYWYGVCYAAGLAATYMVITREARRRGLDPRVVDNGIIIVAVAALAGGRAYHVIDQWHLYADNPVRIFLPPYTGLGVYGGIVTGTLAMAVCTRLWKQSFWRWADVVAPGLFVMQAIGRWGNFFNQELYGPPTDLPWGITIDCAHRISDHGTPQFACSQYPFETTGFHPLFLYESISGILGALALLWLARRFGPRMRPGDLLLTWFIWYAVVRFALETLRSGNWTVGGIPTAMIVSAVIVVLAGGMLLWRHRPSASAGDRWGEAPARVDDRDVVEEVDEDDEFVDEVEVEEVAGGDVAAVDHDDSADGGDVTDEPASNERPASDEPTRGDGA
jgi:phosphatidylglycerol---prolipoprotein diacylglyceryl transferase